MPTSTIKFIRPKQHAGVIYDAGSQITIDSALADLYVSDGVATYVAKTLIPNGEIPLALDAAGDLIQAGTDRRIALRGPQSAVILFGDSRIDTEYVAANNGYSTTSRGVFTIANALAGQRCRVVKYAGIGGNKYSDLVARYMTDVRPYAKDASWLYIMCDLNDVANDVPLDTIKANARQIWDWAAQDGLRIIETAGYFPSVGKELTATRNQVLLQLSAFKRREASLRRNFFVVDANALIGNSAAATPSTPAAKIIDSSTGSGFHINVGGAYPIAKAVAAILTSQVPPTDRLVSSVADCYGTDATNPNIFDYGLFQGTTGDTSGAGYIADASPGAFTAGVPTGIKPKRNAGACSWAPSVGTASDGVGNALRLKITGAGATDVVQVSTTTALTSRVAGGQSFVGRSRVIITNPVGLHTVYQRIIATVDGVTYQWRSIMDMTPLNGAIPEGCTLTHETPLATLPNGTVSNFENQILIVFSAAGASAQIDIERMSCERVA